MGFFTHDTTDIDNHNALSNGTHKGGKLSHELIAGAASYAAARAYEKHVEREQAETGKPPNHSHDQIKAILAGGAGMWVDKLVETKMLEHHEAKQIKEDAALKAQNRMQL